MAGSPLGGSQSQQPSNKIAFSFLPSGTLQLWIPECRLDWFTPAQPEIEEPMEWDALLWALSSIANVADCLASDRRVLLCKHHEYVHAGIDLRSMKLDGTLTGHCLEYVAAAARAPKPGLGLLIGDPRFAAPELFAGDYPTMASDLHAAAAVFCARNSPQAVRNTLPRLEQNNWSVLPRHRVDPIDKHFEGVQRALLLSLLDDDPEVRLLALKKAPSWNHEAKVDGQRTNHPAGAPAHGRRVDPTWPG